MINVGRGTQAWAGFSVADSPLVHKDPQTFIVQKSFGLKQDVKWNPIPVLTQGMQEPINYRFEGMHAVAGNVQTPLYPEQTMKLLKSVFGGVSFSGLLSTKVVITVDNISDHIYFKINSETQISLSTTGVIADDTATLLAAINGAVGSIVTAAYVDAGDHALGLILTGSDLFNLIITAGGSLSTATQTVQSGYTHILKGTDAVPNLPLAFTFYEDLSQMNLVGCYPTTFDLEIDKGNPVQLTMAFAGMHGYDQKGTAAAGGLHGDSGGGPLVFPVTTTSATVKPTVGSDPQATIIIPDATYATAAELEAAINTAAESTEALLDTYRRPKCAFFIDENFLYFGGVSPCLWAYTDGKGAAQTIDLQASNLFPGTTTQPTPVAGTDTAVKPSESLIQPFIATKVRAFLGGPGGVEIPGVEKMKISVNNGMGLLETIGFYFAHIPVIHKRREVKVTLDLAFTDTTFLSKFLANTTIAIYALLETGVAIGSTTDKYKAEVFLNTCKILKMPLPAVSGQDYIKQVVEAQAFYDPTYQDIEIKVVNSLATV